MAYPEKPQDNSILLTITFIITVLWILAMIYGGVTTP